MHRLTSATAVLAAVLFGTAPASATTVAAHTGARTQAPQTPLQVALPLPAAPDALPAGLRAAPAHTPVSNLGTFVAPPAPAVAAVPAVAPVPPVVPTLGASALAAARKALGTRYVWGGTGRGGFDCSGLMLWSYKQAGVSLPRSSRAQSGVGKAVSRDQLQPGDLVFFYSPVSHVGIYVGGGMVLHAPQSGDVVKISPMSRMPFHNARRV